MHLISAIDLNLFQPLDLEITQKSLWITQKSLGVILKEEKIIHSFMSRLGEGEQESKGDFWTRRRKRQQFGTHTRQLFSKIRTTERQAEQQQEQAEKADFLLTTEKFPGGPLG